MPIQNTVEHLWWSFLGENIKHIITVSYFCYSKSISPVCLGKREKMISFCITEKDIILYKLLHNQKWIKELFKI